MRCRMTAQGHAYARFKRALRSGNADLALDAAASTDQPGRRPLAATRHPRGQTRPLRQGSGAVSPSTRRTTATYSSATRASSFDLLDGIGRHDQVAVVRLERWLRGRGYDDEAHRVA